LLAFGAVFARAAFNNSEYIDERTKGRILQNTNYYVLDVI